MKIYRLGTTSKKYGGTIYEEMVDKALREENDLEVLHYNYRWPKPFRYVEILNLFLFYIRATRRPGLFIRNLETCLWPSSANTIYLVFHVDWSYSGLFSKIIQIWTWIVFRYFTNKKQHVVVISQYWKDFLEKIGFKNVHLIYCAFNWKEYSVTDGEVENFIQRFDLKNKKIIYIGNPQLKKGADLVYQSLKDLDVLLVCSGEGDLDIPVRRLKLNFKDYLCLLRVSSIVITLSRFKEGWNRVAHEALLMGTPVIGSGKGGMGELLHASRQNIINDDNTLKLTDAVNRILCEKPAIDHKVMEYLRSFDEDRFKNAWKALVTGIR